VRRLLIGLVAALAMGGAVADAPKKVLRYAFEVAETSLDPVKVNDLYSRILTPHLYEGLYRYDHLARPIKVKPLTADGMPVASPDFRVWTIKVQPGIYFADDPAFKGKKRELVAQDYVYSFKRFADPANKSPAWSGLETERLVGLNELRQAALDAKKPFDYDREIDGVRALDRYTLRFTLTDPRPRFYEALAGSDLFGAVAREVIEFYGDEAEMHPVGTGPFKLAQWRRSSFLAFDRNPDYRERFYDAEPAPDDAEGQAVLVRLKGRRLPMIDRVEISIIEEEQPRWLSFVNNEADLQFEMGFQFVTQAMPNGRVAPHLAKRGIQGYQNLEPTVYCAFFNLEDPVVGGYAPVNVALRRAIGLGLDSRTEIAYAFNGQGIVAQTPLLPHTMAYDPHYRSEFGEYDPARAKALLDLYGYVDRNGDGWRDQPDGTPLVIEYATQPDDLNRQLITQWQKNMEAIGIRMVFKTAQWPENLKSSHVGKLMMWGVAWTAGPDGEGFLLLGYGPAKGEADHARFDLPEYNRLFDLQRTLPDGPERKQVMTRMKELAVAYMPYKAHVHRIWTDLAQPWVVGYHRNVFMHQFWRFVDIDPAERARRLK
jgi:ABC-type transport system substrate-binding protein